MIEIIAPRYRDRTVLLARYRLPCGQDVDVKILRGAYKGFYRVSNEAIVKAPIEEMKTKAGKMMSMRAVPLDAMERTGDVVE